MSTLNLRRKGRRPSGQPPSRNWASGNGSCEQWQNEARSGQAHDALFSPQSPRIQSVILARLEVPAAPLSSLRTRCSPETSLGSLAIPRFAGHEKTRVLCERTSEWGAKWSEMKLGPCCDTECPRRQGVARRHPRRRVSTGIPVSSSCSRGLRVSHREGP
ncbi:hypothetical protein FA13DRAFT_1726842 [Coprinellus micaceus]|uniref:Uncharacterized protein n=1 Tax=Coprinellus micaceus TaxID=71717 RepID=A0A4Y7TQN3_COPMI|nr:hypothetical protein FA13DRAFT_1726842 [Coprinellus micaceus]